jgi:lipoprotein-anchoring transpeptidase ErfK/SrfK
MTLSLAFALTVALAQTSVRPEQPQQKPPAQPAQTAAPADKTAAAGKTAATDKTVSEALRIQVMLDRAGFSPGAIDGRTGPSTRKALAAYQKQVGETPQEPFEPLRRHRITPEDAAGPFVEEIPKELVDQAKLPHLGYRSIVEALAERYHATPALLQRLNPNVRFGEGEEIVVPNVEPLAIPSTAQQAAQGRGREGTPAPPAKKAAGATGTTGTADVVVTVSKGTSALTVADATGRVLFYAPVTTGSENDPLPIGEWKVNGVSMNPTFNYNPKLFWDANPADAKAKIPPGPNNPVGLVWIDLTKEHYGIHGSPEPTTIGKTESHGCVRLTNWDAVKLAGMVKPGTRVVFTQ